MNNFWLIPMDFRTCNYEQMKEEWDENKKIMWEAPGKPTNKNGEWTVENTMAKSLKKGMWCIFMLLIYRQKVTSS